MAAIVTLAKPNLLSLVWLDYLCQDGHLDTLINKIFPEVMILSTVVEYFFSSIFGHLGGSGTTCKWFHYDSEINGIV